MPRVPTSVYLGLETWVKTRDYRVNRSEIARRALEEEVRRIEAENNKAGESCQASAPTVTHSEGHPDVDGGK